MYVTNAYSGNVSIIDTATQTVTSTILTVGKYPQGIAVNATGTRAYVANSDSSDVTILDLVNNKTLATVPIASGYPVGVALNANDTRVYVTSNSNGQVSVIDTASNTVIATVPVGSYPMGVAFNPSGTRVYVANRTPGSVSVIDTATNTAVATINIGGYINSLTVDPAGTRVYVTNSNSGAVHIIDTATNTILSTVPVGGWPSGITLNTDGTRAYVSTGKRVAAFDTASNSITAIATVPWGTDDAFGQFIAQVPCPCDQTISFGSLPGLTYGASSYTLDAKASSALPVEFTSTTPSVCLVNGNKVDALAVGYCTIQASQPGNAAYKLATPVTQSLYVGKGNQEIICGPAPVVTVGGSGTLNCTGGASGNSIVFNSTTPAVCTTSGTNGSTVTGVAVSNCIIAANQAGNGNYNDASTVTQSIAVLKGDQTIICGTPPTVIVGGTGTMNCTGGMPGNPVTFNSTTTAICTTSGTNGSTVTGKAVGSCTIAADQAGNANYNAAPQVTQTFSVTTGVALTVINSNKTFGTITSDAGGIACGATCSAHFINGTLVKLTASPAAGYQFSGWGGACIGYGNTYSVTMNADKSCTGNFEPFKKKRSPGWRKWLLSQ
jgi:YVTN family beta-propeller protein